MVPITRPYLSGLAVRTKTRRDIQINGWEDVVPGLVVLHGTKPAWRIVQADSDDLPAMSLREFCRLPAGSLPDRFHLTHYNDAVVGIVRIEGVKL